MKLKYQITLTALPLILVSCFIGLLHIFEITGWGFTLYEHHPAFKQEKFDTEVWKAKRRTNEYKMVHDLLNNHLKAGLSKQEVIRILGDNDESNSRFHYGIYTDFCCSFVIEQFLSADDLFIFIEFDENGNLINKGLTGW